MKIQHKNKGGFTLVELMVAAAVSSTGLVVLMGSLLAVDNHEKISDYEAIGTSFNLNVLEFVQNQGFSDFDDLATYDPGLADQEGIVSVPGFGDADFDLYAIIPVDGGANTLFEIGVDDPETILNPPNPIEVQAVITTSNGDRSHYTYTTSTIISF